MNSGAGAGTASDARSNRRSGEEADVQPQRRPAGPGRPRDPHVDRAIIDSAVELLRDGGVEALSMESVANRAGVSRASVYRRYANRVDLMEAVFQAASARKPDPPDTGSTRTDLVQLVLIFKKVLLDEEGGGLLPAMISAARENPEVREALERFSSSRRSPTVEVIHRGIERCEIRGDIEPELLADLLIGAVIYRVLVRNETIGAKRAAQLVDLVLAGASTSND